MAKIKKLKENGSTVYPATIPEAVVDTNGFTLAYFMDELLGVLSHGDRGHLDLAMSDLRSSLGADVSLDMYLEEMNQFVDKVNAFLNDADASDTTINRWKEIESFLTGITDTKTLTGLLAETLQSAKSYADGKVSSGTANMVTMSSNAGTADRVLTSAGSNKTAKDSGVLLSDLAKKNLSNVELATLIDKGVGIVSVHEYTLSGDSISNLSSFMGGISADKKVYLAKDSGSNGLSPIIVVEDPSTGSVACMFVASNRRLYYVYADDDTSSYVSKSTFIGDAASTEVDGLMSAADKAKLNGIAAGANKYVLPVASASALGGVKSGGNITVGSDGAVTVNKAVAADMAAHATEADRASYATSAGSATSATKATQDGNGATITATYLKAAAVTDVTEYAEITI